MVRLGTIVLLAAWVKMIKATVACNLDHDLLLATIPLFSEEKVEAIEWSFDTLYRFENIPSWFYDLITFFSKEKRLLGHGVFFSLFSGQWSKEQEKWLADLSAISKEYSFSHITEHFGFMTGENFHNGAPLSIPFTSKTLKLGIDRIKRISQACECPVGLENLAFAYAKEEIIIHAEFLEKLIEPVNGFIILDLHNLYCQAHNFDISPNVLISYYPLERIREIHISGGSWESSEYFSGNIRRDTHDDAVPKEVFDLLAYTIPLCPNLEFVIMEQLGAGLKTEQKKQQFRSDYRQMYDLIKRIDPQKDASNSFLPDTFELNNTPVEDLDLYRQQMELSKILEDSKSLKVAQESIANSSLKNSAWNTDNWEKYMLDTAMQIAQKWKASDT